MTRRITIKQPEWPDYGSATLRLLSIGDEHRYDRDNWRWRWAVETQPHRELTWFTTTQTGPRSRARPVIEALADRALTDGDDLDLDDLIGRGITVELVPKSKDNPYPTISPNHPVDGLAVEVAA